MSDEILQAGARAVHRLTCVICPDCGGPDESERYIAEAVILDVTPLIQANGPDQLAAAVAMLKAHEVTLQKHRHRIVELLKQGPAGALFGEEGKQRALDALDQWYRNTRPNPSDGPR